MDARPWPILAEELSKHARLQAQHSLTRSSGSCTPGPPTYLRVAKTASTSVLDYLHRTNCTAHVRVEDHHRTTAGRFAESQPLLIVLREPCDRAASTLAHWRSLGPSARNEGRHQLVNLTSYAEYVWRRWRHLNVHFFRSDTYTHTHTHTHTHTQQVLGSFMRTCCAQAPWSGRTASNALAWMQSRYVNGCTRFLCFGARPCERIMVDVCRPASPRCLANLLRLIHASPPGDRLEAGLQRLCASSRGLAHENAASKPARNGVDNDAAGCALVRQVYAADWRTWRTHCAAGVVVGVLGQHKVGL